MAPTNMMPRYVATMVSARLAPIRWVLVLVTPPTYAARSARTTRFPRDLPATRRLRFAFHQLHLFHHHCEAGGTAMDTKTDKQYPVTHSEAEWRKILSPEQYRVMRD